MGIIRNEADLILAIKLELDKIFSFTTAVMEDGEVKYYIFKAIMRYFKRMIGGFEQDQRMTDGLRRLLVAHRLSGDNDDSGIWLDSNTNIKKTSIRISAIETARSCRYVQSVSELATIAESNNKNPGMAPQIIKKTWDTYLAEVNNPLSDFHWHNGRCCPIRIEDDTFITYLIPKEVKIREIHIWFLKDPIMRTNTAPYDDAYSCIVQNFGITALDELITDTVHLMLEAIGEERFQTYSSIQNSAYDGGSNKG